MKTIEGYDVKIYTDNIEESALEQIKELLSINVFSDKKIRIMPDVHAGAGCVIGFTGDLGDKVIPNIVGVDIGCGMRVLNLGKLADIDYHPSMSISAAMFLQGKLFAKTASVSSLSPVRRWKSIVRRRNSSPDSIAIETSKIPVVSTELSAHWAAATTS